MSVRTTILDLAMAIYDEAVTLVGEGPAAQALADAALADMLARSTLADAQSQRQPQVVAHRGRPERWLRASA